VIIVSSIVPLVFRQYGRYHFVINERCASVPQSFSKPIVTGYVRGVIDEEIIFRQQKGELAMQQFLVG